MPRVQRAVAAIVGMYPVLPVVALSLDITEFAADITNFEQVPLSGPVLLMVHNTAGTPGTFTLTSVADDKRRTGDITAYSLAAGAIALIKIDQTVGWRQNDGQLYFQGSAATIKFACLAL